MKSNHTRRCDSVLQEMFEEYFRGLNLPGTPAKTFRLRVFLFFDMIQEPLTPAEYEDGCAFFRTSRSFLRLQCLIFAVKVVNKP